MSGTLEDQFFIWFLVQTSKQIDRKDPSGFYKRYYYGEFDPGSG